MRVACLFITCNRLNESLECIQQNFFNAELDADVFLIDNGSEVEIFNEIRKAYPFNQIRRFPANLGIASAINEGIRMAEGYDAVVTLANDILMPQGWLRRMVEVASDINDTGMVGIHCVEELPPISLQGVHPTWCCFGNVLIPMAAIKKVGAFNTDFDPYGMQDSDYGYRLDKTGHRSYYLRDAKSEHIGHDVGQDSAYRKMKDEGLAKAGEIYAKAIEKYDSTGNYYIPL